MTSHEMGRGGGGGLRGALSLPYSTDLRLEFYDHTYSYILQTSNCYTYSYFCLLKDILFVCVYEDFMTFHIFHNRTGIRCLAFIGVNESYTLT